jgi:chromosome segregation ATPase
MATNFLQKTVELKAAIEAQQEALKAQQEALKALQQRQAEETSQQQQQLAAATAQLEALKAQLGNVEAKVPVEQRVEKGLGELRKVALRLNKNVDAIVKDLELLKKMGTELGPDWRELHPDAKKAFPVAGDYPKIRDLPLISQNPEDGSFYINLVSSGSPHKVQ